jgi:hypothetical protein
VTAGADVVATLVPTVKNGLVGAFTVVALVKNVPGVVATVVPLVKNVFGVEVTLVTTGVVGPTEPVTTGTVRRGPILPVWVVFEIWRPPAPLLPGEKGEPVPPLLKRYAAVALAVLALGLNATVTRSVGRGGVWAGGGMMPVTVPVVAPVNTVPVTGLRVALVTAVPVVPGLRAALVTAFPKTGLRFALVKNGAALVVTPFTAGAIVDFTSVTTVAPGCPLTSFTALAKVGFTPVTHVSAEAEANSAAFRLATLTVSKRKRPVMFPPPGSTDTPRITPPLRCEHRASDTLYVSFWPKVRHGDARREFVLTCCFAATNGAIPYLYFARDYHCVLSRN